MTTKVKLASKKQALGNRDLKSNSDDDVLIEAVPNVNVTTATGNTSESSELQPEITKTNRKPRKFKTLLIFSTAPDQSRAGAELAIFKLVTETSTGRLTVRLDWEFENVEHRIDAVDGHLVAEAISSIFQKIGWIAAQTSCHEVLNCAPRLLTKDLVKGIIERTLIGIQEGDDVPTSDRFMAERYTEKNRMQLPRA